MEIKEAYKFRVKKKELNYVQLTVQFRHRRLKPACIKRTRLLPPSLVPKLSCRSANSNTEHLYMRKPANRAELSMVGTLMFAVVCGLTYSWTSQISAIPHAERKFRSNWSWSAVNQRAAKGPRPARQPVIMLSLGRSGSSLLADVLNRHPAIVFAGEWANMPGHWLNGDSSLVAAFFRQWRSTYDRWLSEQKHKR